MTTTGKTTFRDNVMRVIAIIGLIAVLLLGAWGIIQLAFYIPTLFSGSGSHIATPVAENVSVSVTSPVTSGQPMTVTWRRVGPDEARSYTVSYSCVGGLTIKAPTPSGKDSSVPCNTAFNFTGATNSMTVTPTLTGTKQAQVTFVVTSNQLTDNKVAASGQASATVLPKASAVKTTTKSTGSTYTAAPRTTNLFGYSDLAVRVLSVNPQGTRTSVQFEVSNVGTNVAPAGWSFNALIPSATSQTAQPYTYPSGAQRMLYPGDKIVFTIGFDSNGYAGGNYNYNNQYTYNSQTGYQNTYVQNYNNCYSYNGYQNVPAPCTGQTNPYPYGYTGNTANPYSNNYNYTHSLIIQVDPYNQIVESNESNNTVTTTTRTY